MTGVATRPAHSLSDEGVILVDLGFQKAESSMKFNGFSWTNHITIKALDAPRISIVSQGGGDVKV